MTSVAPRKYRVIVVDGIIGAGKTTFINECLVNYLTQLGLKVVVVEEPVELWKQSGALKQFYEDPSRRAYQFQTRAFHDRIKLARQRFAEHKDSADVFILERSIFTDVLFMQMLHDSGTIDESEYRDYMDLWTMWSALMPFTPDLFVYLRPPVGEAMRRLRHRNRDGEAGVSEDYQVGLLTKHDEFLGKAQATISKDGVELSVPVICFTTSKNFVTDNRVRDKLCSRVHVQITVSV